MCDHHSVIGNYLHQVSMSDVFMEPYFLRSPVVPKELSFFFPLEWSMELEDVYVIQVVSIFHCYSCVAPIEVIV